MGSSFLTEIMLWRRLDLPGHEIARLEANNDGWKLSGTAIFLSQLGPSKLEYVVSCDAAWWTNSAPVRGRIGAQEIVLNLTADPERRWHLKRS
jgi:hypothetical protein